MQKHTFGKTRVWCSQKDNTKTLLAVMMLAGSAIAEAKGRNPHYPSGKASSGTSQSLKLTPHRSMVLVRYDGKEYFVKQFHPSEFYKRVTQFCRGQSNARLIGRTGLEFQSRGLSVPPVVGVIEEKGSTASALITESIDDCPSIEKLLEEAVTLPDGKSRLQYKAFITQALAKEWWRLHQAGINYAESHTRHIYVFGNVEAFRQGKMDGWEFRWIDYDGTQFYAGQVPEKNVIQHFFHLSRDYRRKERLRNILSRSDMMRFLYFYYQQNPQADHHTARQQAKQAAGAVLSWQPRLYARWAIPVRDGWRWVFRPSEREFKRQRNKQKQLQKLAKSDDRANLSHKHS